MALGVETSSVHTQASRLCQTSWVSSRVMTRPGSAREAPGAQIANVRLPGFLVVGQVRLDVERAV
eukprot:1264397-Pyramimonas_sp.AAC.1